MKQVTLKEKFILHTRDKNNSIVEHNENKTKPINNEN